ncbi:hypothetical protein ACLOJK_005280 [Asimina triloba]
MEFLSSLLFSLLITAAAAVLVVLVSFSIFFLRIYTGKSINSSLYAPVVGTVFHRVFYVTRLYDQQTDVARKHRTFRLLGLAQSEVFTADPRNIEHVLKTYFDDYNKGEHNHGIMRDLFGDGIFNSDGDGWRQQRKLASFEFSTRVLRDFSCHVFRKNAVKLAGIIADLGATKQAFDIQDLLMKCTLDSIFKVGFGVDLNCLDGTSKAGNEFIKAFDDSSALVSWRYVDFLWKIKRFLNLGSKAVLRKNIKAIDGFVYGVIREKRRKLSNQIHCNEKEDILSRFLVESEKNPTKMTDKYLRNVILNFIIADKDTTANTLSWFLYMMCKNPLIQEKIAQQVRDVLLMDENSDHGSSNTVDDFARKITDSTLDKDAVSPRSTGRDFEAASSCSCGNFSLLADLMDGKCAAKDDILPDGYRVKKGDGVYYVAYAMGRMTYLWGDDAEEFRPERWLQNGLFQPESPFKFVSFHGGPRICLGKEFAYRQMKITAMVLLGFFRFQLDDEKKQVKYRTTFTLHMDGGLKLRAFSRNHALIDQNTYHVEEPSTMAELLIPDAAKANARGKWHSSEPVPVGPLNMRMKAPPAELVMAFPC